MIHAWTASPRLPRLPRPTIRISGGRGWDTGMKLDASALRYLTKEDFRILSALEIGSKNHEVVPLTMIANLARMRPGGVNARLFELAKHRLVSKEHHASYEGFRLTYGGYDYLALHALAARGSVEGVGRQIGVGKESDVYLVAGRRPPVVEDAATTETNAETKAETKDAAPPTSDDDRRGMGNEDDGEASLESFVLKIERLGRTSFRSVKSNRDYVGHRKHVSWMYMSRLAAEKEWAFLRALHARGFPTPRPIDWNRHCIVMEWIDGRVLDQLHPEDWPVTVHVPLLQIAQHLYSLLMRLLVRLAEHGLIHGDFNEFNLMVREAYLAAPTLAEQDEASSPASSPIVIIDFPQMVSTAHRNARELFDRDVNCLRTFFRRRFGFEAAEWPDFDRDVQVEDDGQLLDAQLKASGFKGRLNDADGEDSEDCSDDGDADSEDHCRDDPSSDPE